MTIRQQVLQETMLLFHEWQVEYWQTNIGMVQLGFGKYRDRIPLISHALREKKAEWLRNGELAKAEYVAELERQPASRSMLLLQSKIRDLAYDEMIIYWICNRTRIGVNTEGKWIAMDALTPIQEKAFVILQELGTQNDIKTRAEQMPIRRFWIDRLEGSIVGNTIAPHVIHGHWA